MCYSIVRMYSMYVRSARRKLCWEDRGERILFLSGLGQTDRLTNEVEWKTRIQECLHSRLVHPKWNLAFLNFSRQTLCLFIF